MRPMRVEKRIVALPGDEPKETPVFAFPYRMANTDQFCEAGMTLRDYFAGQALGGMHGRDYYDPGQTTPEQRARLCYIDADAMMAERLK